MLQFVAYGSIDKLCKSLLHKFRMLPKRNHTSSSMAMDLFNKKSQGEYPLSP